MNVVISAMGAVSAYGISIEALHQGLLAARRSFREQPLFADLKLKSGLVATVADVPSSEQYSRSTAFALLAADEAIKHLSPEERKTTAVIVGGTTAGMHKSESCFLDPPFAGIHGLTPQLVKQHQVGETAAVVGKTYQLYGPRTTLVSACSSGLNAIILAKRWLQQNKVDRVLAIGTDSLCRLTFAGFASLNAIDHAGMRPFHRDRCGLTLGEGAAAFLIEREIAGKSFLARILGTSLVGEAYHVTQPDPSGEGARRAMKLALQQAQISPSAIDVVSAHATGTRQNDSMECAAIASLLGSKVTVTAQKSGLGHTLGAAGALELAASLLMLRHQIVYPTIGLTPETLDPACAGVQHVFAEPRPLVIHHLMKNSFAFGGQNSSLVMGRGEK